MTWPAVLLTDAPSNANLAALRSLGRRGVPVGVLGFPDEFNLGFHSRYARVRHLVPSPSADPGGFVRGLESIVASGRYGVVLPTTERTIQLLSAHRDVLPAGVACPLPSREAVDGALDKERTLALAASLGVPAPRTWCPEGPAALAELAPALPYPVVVKPRQTNFLAADGRLAKAGYAVVRDPAALDAAWRRIDAAVPRPLVQELVPGIGAGVFSLWDRGTPLVWFAHRRRREEDPRGGRASAAVSAAPDHRLVEPATRLLKALGWHGVAMVEWKLDPATGRFWLMEINGRFWGSLALALAAGVDFPWYAYQLALGHTVEAASDYPEGVLARDALAELKHFVRVMGPGPRAASCASRWQTLRAAPEILHPSRRSYNWTPDDPTPGRREWLRFIGRLVGRG